MLTSQERDEAVRTLNHMKSYADADTTIELYNEHLERFIDTLESMLSGDPWREASYAVDILSIIGAANF